MSHNTTHIMNLILTQMKLMVNERLVYSGAELNFPGVNYVYMQNGGLYNAKAHLEGMGYAFIFF